MNLTQEQIAELKTKGEQLIKFLNENCHPHCTLVITQGGFTLNEVHHAHSTTEYLKD